MTTTDIETAFKKAVDNNELNAIEILNRFDRSNLKNKPTSIARKLEILWMLDKLKLT